MNKEAEESSAADCLRDGSAVLQEAATAAEGGKADSSAAEERGALLREAATAAEGGSSAAEERGALLQEAVPAAQIPALPKQSAELGVLTRELMEKLVPEAAEDASDGLGMLGWKRTGAALLVYSMWQKACKGDVSAAKLIREMNGEADEEGGAAGRGQDRRSLWGSAGKAGTPGLRYTDSGNPDGGPDGGLCLPGIEELRAMTDEELALLESRCVGV